MYPVFDRRYVSWPRTPVTVPAGQKSHVPSPRPDGSEKELGWKLPAPFLFMRWQFHRVLFLWSCRNAQERWVEKRRRSALLSFSCLNFVHINRYVDFLLLLTARCWTKHTKIMNLFKRAGILVHFLRFQVSPGSHLIQFTWCTKPRCRSVEQCSALREHKPLEMKMCCLL